jgi:hypothetical protein
MRIGTSRKRRASGLIVAGVLGFVAVATATGLAGVPLEVLRRVRIGRLGFDDQTSLVQFKFHLCNWLELAVVLLQVVGVATLCVTRLLPTSRWAVRSRFGFVAAMVGLGVAGAVCASYDSEFALFAGAAMAVLLIVAILDRDPAHAPTSAGSDSYMTT